MAKNGIKSGGKDWKPGKSGNPNGRPKTGNSFRDIFEKLLNEDLIEIEQSADGKISEKNYGNSKELLAKAILKHAISGSYQHANMIIERLDGKIPNINIEYEGEDIEIEAFEQLPEERQLQYFERLLNSKENRPKKDTQLSEKLD